jgi:hypothetical protein
MLTISGVRGAVTLAGAFTIPYTAVNGSSFPERSLLIFIAAGVILVTLVAASILLPILGRTENKDPLSEELERSAMLRTIEAAIRTVEELTNDKNRGAAVSVITAYNHLRNHFNHVPENKSAESEIRMNALDAEARYIEKLIRSEQIDRETLYVVEEHIQRMRLAVTNRLQYRRLFIWTLIKRSFYRIYYLIVPESQKRRKNHKVRAKRLIQLKVGMAKAAIRFLRDQMTPEYETIYLDIIGEYNDLITKVRLAKKGTDSVEFIQTQRDLQIKAFQAERNEIQNLYEEGAVTIEVTRKIRKQINIREAYWMEGTNINTT